MVIYADLLFLNNTLMTYVIIWAVSSLLDLEFKWWRILLGSIMATFYTFLVLVLINYNLPAYFHLFLNILFAFLIIRISFGFLLLKNLLKAVFYFYLLSFFLIGSLYTIFNFYGFEYLQRDRILISSIVFALLIIFITARRGWVLLHKHVNIDNFIVSLIIEQGEKKIFLQGLLDTGNKLSDPLSREPVIIVELSKFLPLLPEKLAKKIKKTDELQIFKQVEMFEKFSLSNRIRLLPFNDLRGDHGLLVGFRPDKVSLESSNKCIKTQRVIIGLTQNRLDEQQQFQALIPPDIFTADMEPLPYKENCS